ncbi:hypothetical protein GWI33_001150 [Rhynchophorus ferrugineus]|uniref:Uncharacterized protein n=1 Tax=Rhynchophorus ferrugineus TaxID=354439 RepID=A0A834ISM1_RHYFE|nr:hypothetical protein GWI33_001150 [Rhynchophorus ferrugineus]
MKLRVENKDGIETKDLNKLWSWPDFEEETDELHRLSQMELSELIRDRDFSKVITMDSSSKSNQGVRPQEFLRQRFKMQISSAK